ncbi:MAG: cyclic nucleotide-binding domain-containing protein [Anaerolineales bacterium]
MSQIPLQSVPLFSSLNTLELSEVSQSMRLKILKDGQILFREGDVGKSFFIVTHGKVEVIKAMGTAEERLLNYVEEGEFFGEMSLLVPDSKRSASVRGVGEETFLFELQSHRFEDLIQNQPAFAYKMIQAMSDRLRANNESTITDLREKNQELARAYEDLKAAQAELIIKENQIIKWASQLAMFRIKVFRRRCSWLSFALFCVPKPGEIRTRQRY